MLRFIPTSAEKRTPARRAWLLPVLSWGLTGPPLLFSDEVARRLGAAFPVQEVGTVAGETRTAQAA